MSKRRTCLVYHIDKYLCVFPNEAMDCVTHIVAQENGLDQGGELMQSERASDQTSTGWRVGVEKEEGSGSNQHCTQDDKGGAEGVPLSDTGVVVSTGPELLLSTQPYCCACGFANPCLGGTNDDLSFPSDESLSCEAPSPLSEGVSYPSAFMSDVGLGTALASPGSKKVPSTRCEGLGPIPPEYFECSLSLVIVAGIPSVRALCATELEKKMDAKLATGRVWRLTAVPPCHSSPRDSRLVRLTDEPLASTICILV